MNLIDKYYGLEQSSIEALLNFDAKNNGVSVEKNLSQSMGASVSNKTKLIPVTGVLFPRENLYTAMGFGMALSRITEQLTNAANDPAILQIVFIFDSPGGAVSGINALANSIRSTE
jgi:ClpP class serine protease